MLPDIVFQKKQGQSGRTIPGQDYVSGLVFYTNSLPSGFTSSARVKQLFSTADAIAAGILNDYSDATAATGTYLVTTAGTNGDTVTFSVTEYGGGVKVIGTYKKVSGDSTAANVATKIAAAINSGTATHGYSATVSTATVTIIAPKKFGIYLNSGTPISVAYSTSATLAGTLTQFSGGVGSKLAVFYYVIARYFAKQKGSNGTDGLYVGFYDIPTTYDFTEITLMQNIAQGVIRQIGILKDTASAYSSSDLTLIHNEIVSNNDGKHKPLSALYAADLSGTADITTIADLTAITAYKASSVIGMDGAAQGMFLYKTTGKSVPQLGDALGMLSLSSVSEDFGQPVDKFNLSDGGGLENDVPALSNGVLLNTLSDAVITSIDSKRHIFGMKYVGTTGTYFNDNHTACALDNDYAYINDNRVIDKAIRGVYSSVLPKLKGVLILNSDGTLAATTVATLQNLALAPLFQMNRDGDLSEVVADDVYINPAQNVKSTSSVTINISLNEDGIARQILIPIGFKA